jgi:hypothetical protein
MVKQLNDLVPFIHQRVPDAKTLLAARSESNSKILVLFETFVHQTFDTDEAAAAYLGEGWSVSTYKSHAKRLHQYLLEMLMFLESASSEFLSEVEKGAIKTMQLRLLYNNGRYASAFEVAKELLNMGLTFERPLWVAEASRHLIILFGSGEYEKVKDIEYFFELLKVHSNYVLLEQKAEYHWMKVSSYYRKNKGYSEDLIKLSDAALQELAPHEPNIHI